MMRQYTVEVRNVIEQTSSFHTVVAETMKITDEEIVFQTWDDLSFVTVGAFTKHPDVIYSITSKNI